MKKILLLLAAASVAVNANSQQLRHTSLIFSGTGKKTAAYKLGTGTHVRTPLTGARTTSTVFLTEDFGTGTHASLPTGWTTGTLNVGTWKWTNLASSSQYTMGVMTSTTASNGWMIFDSDSTGAATSGTPAGWLQSPAYNCSAHPHVGLVFQDYYRKFNDSCFVWVSTSSSFATYTKYVVGPNNTLSTNISTDNPTTVKLDISAAAGGQSTVYIRFVTFGPSLGAYSWMIDDLNLVDPDAIDVSLSKASAVYFSGSDAGFYAFGAIPAKYADTVFPEVFVANTGYTAMPALPVSAQIYSGGTSVYSSTFNANAPVNAFDTLADFTQASPRGYYPGSNGSYTVAFNISPTGDAVTSDNNDTVGFAVTDSTWSENAPGKAIVGQTYVYKPGSSPVAQSPAAMFSIPAGQNDTLTSVSITFGSATKVGQVVGAQIYHFDGTSWFYDGSTQYHAITSTDLASKGVFPITVSGGIVLQGNSGGVLYAAVVKGSGNTDSVSVQESENPAPESIMNGGSSGLSDSSLNDGASTTSFGSPLPTALPFTPLIDLNFGVVFVDHTGVKQLTAFSYIGTPYPNPANTVVNIPFALSTSSDVTVTLSDIVGQSLKIQKMWGISGSAKATFATGDLPSGIYLYSLEANGSVINGRIVVNH